MRSQQLDAARAVAGDLDGVALAAEPGGDRVGDRLLVLDDHDGSGPTVALSGASDVTLEDTRQGVQESARACGEIVQIWPGLASPARGP